MTKVRGLVMSLLCFLLAGGGLLYFLFARGRVFDPAQMDTNQIIRSLVDLSKIPRRGFEKIDATNIFDKHLSRRTLSAVISDIHELGMDWSDPDLERNRKGGVAIEYSVLRRIPESAFRPNDEVGILFNLVKDDKVQIYEAWLVNKSAFP